MATITTQWKLRGNWGGNRVGIANYHQVENGQIFLCVGVMLTPSIGRTPPVPSSVQCRIGMSVALSTVIPNQNFSVGGNTSGDVVGVGAGRVVVVVNEDKVRVVPDTAVSAAHPVVAATEAFDDRVEINRYTPPATAPGTTKMVMMMMANGSRMRYLKARM
ncbi:hypothetical protein M427DRAFT_383472 [Gonapodya prolifera JEL478]|uniref:Uncharacterized protein n=1 Tax=Gonapodya prolifera (strain JEL478) TaxID=1344416 RepID=A0A139A933_GONPJ|nr:hypothetical protein M427DRAFT_383472 [Gonapodya prolifera JEL478]|eukprot:KXS13169.1 hypothetical protein M427DRAFT_383472 [Gonapodya prolifera JEL478]